MISEVWLNSVQVPFFSLDSGDPWLSLTIAVRWNIFIKRFNIYEYLTDSMSGRSVKSNYSQLRSVISETEKLIRLTNI